LALRPFDAQLAPSESHAGRDYILNSREVHPQEFIVGHPCHEDDLIEQYLALGAI
jgi:hypothetical protein